jgi:flagellar biosynthesis/type III secretory pathway chaperone
MTAASPASPLLDELIATLQSEQAALVHGETDALPGLAAAKSTMLDRISRAMRGASRTDRLALLDAMSAAQRINDVNAALVAARLSANRARLDAVLALTGTVREPALYGARGALSAAAASRATASA